MTDNRKAGFALIAGSVGGMLTMAIHPTNGSSHFELMAPLAHGLALVSVLLLLLGGFGLAKLLESPDRMAFAALVTFGAAYVAVMIAVSISGFVGPAVLRMMARDVPEAAVYWRITIAAMFQINQAFSKIYSVGAAVSITLWSVCCLRLKRLSRGFALYGLAFSPVVALLVMVGHLRLDVHGMAAVMLSEVIWFVGMGVRMLREDRG